MHIKKRDEIDPLAIFGGEPSFEHPRHVGRPNIPDRSQFFARVNDIFDNKWLTNSGKYVREFEQRVADYVGVRHCVAVCNATVGLEIATRALGLTGEVIIPSFTFIATAHSLLWQGVTPVFCDIDPADYCIDPKCLESLINPRTSGVIGVHLFGRACQTEALSKICRRHNLHLLFDAAHAFGCSHCGRMIGGFGDAEVFSFHATKVINSFEGGAIVTDNDALAEKVRRMKNFGFKGTVTSVGMNGKMTEACAAMGLTSLENLETFIEANRHNYNTYRAGLEGVQGLRVVEYAEDEFCNYHYILIEVEEEAGITRDCLIKALKAENVLAQRYFFPGCHRMEPYCSLFPDTDLLLPNTESVLKKVVCLPTGTSMSIEDVQKVCERIRLILRLGAEVQKRVESRYGKNINAG